HRRRRRRSGRLGVARARGRLPRLVRAIRMAETRPTGREARSEKGSAMKDVVVVEPAGAGITKITLNRPERLNAMNYALVSGLHEAFDSLASDLSCRVIVLTGEGRGFCAGLDLSEGASPPSRRGMGRAQAGMTVQKLIAALPPKMRSLPQPVISAVN